MADLLRAARVAARLSRRPRIVHLVETSPALRQRQQATLASLRRRRSTGTSGSTTCRTGPTHRRRQRVLRRPAGPPVRRDRARLVRAPGRARRRSPRSSACAPSRNRALGDPLRPGDVLEWPAASHRRDAASSPRRLARDRRRGPDHRLRLLGPGLRRHPAGGAAPRLRRSARRAGRGGPDHPCGFPSPRPGGDGRRGCRFTASARRAISCRRSASRPAPPRLKARATPAQAADIDEAARAPDRRGPTGMGELFKVLAFTHPSHRSRSRPARPVHLVARVERHVHRSARTRLATPTSATPSSPGRAACRRASTPRSTAASARPTIRRGCGRTAAAWRRRSASGRMPCQRASGPFARMRSSSKAPGRASARRPTAWRRAVPGLALAITTADCGPVLFADPEAGVDRRGPCGLARGADRRARSDPRRHGAARRQARQDRRGARPDDQPGRLRGRRRISSRVHRRRTPANERFFAAERARRAMPCSTCPASSARGSKAAGIGEFADLGLCTYSRRGAVLQLPPHDPPQEPDYGRLISAIALTP